jgi:hypothetical protein
VSIRDEVKKEIVLGARVRFDLDFRVTATTSFKPWQQRHPIERLLTICPFVKTHLASLAKDESAYGP